VPDSVVWAEAYSRGRYPTWKRRAELEPAPTLIIYNAPPDPQTLAAVLERVQPQTVHVFGVPPPLADQQAFLTQLTVAARNVIEHLDGKVHVDTLCGATAQSPQVVRAGLDLLAAQGVLGGATWRNRSNVTISRDIPPGENGHQRHDPEAMRARLERAYREVEAYRRYFHTAPLDALIKL